MFGYRLGILFFYGYLAERQSDAVVRAEHTLYMIPYTYIHFDKEFQF